MEMLAELAGAITAAGAFEHAADLCWEAVGDMLGLSDPHRQVQAMIAVALRLAARLVTTAV
jgi:hypothetical protein